MKNSRTLSLLIILLLSTSLVTATAPSNGFSYDLSISKAPKLGDTAEITAVFEEITKSDNFYLTELSIALPEGLELVEGDLTVEKYFNKRAEHSVTVRAVEKGDWTIEGIARSPPFEAIYFGGKDTVQISVYQYWAFIRYYPIPKPVKPCPNGVNCATSERPSSFMLMLKRFFG